MVDFSYTNIRKGIKHWHGFDNYFREHGEDKYHGSQVTITLLRRILRTYNSLLFKGRLPYKPEKN
jgi:limonene-1,2-epoxide hydrolase